MIWKDKREEYKGSWLNGVPHGYGEYNWLLDALRDHQYPMYNIYRGFFVGGKRHGFGIFQYANGAKYEGEWSENLKHGKAIYSTENGRQYVGLFENDRPIQPFSRFENGKLD